MLLITGNKGQLGTELSALLPDALKTDYDTLDITDEAAVKAFVKENNVDTIINCAAYTAVDKAETDVDAATKLNVDGVRNLAKSGAAVVVHVSTDYVFDGSSCRPYVETDTPHPVSVYGKTKKAGEDALLEEAPTAAVVRTAWLYSPYGNNFVKTMRRLGQEKESLNVIFDQVGTPTYAADLAHAIVELLPHIQKGSKEIYHFSNEGVCSWYDFAKKIMELSGLSCEVRPIESKDYPTLATRPFYSVLNKVKIKSVLHRPVPHWEDALKRCLKEMDR